MADLIKTSNPALSAKTFQSQAGAFGQAEPMTLQGTVNKTGVLLFCAFATAAYSWQQAMINPDAAGGWMMLGFIGGLVLALVTVFKKEWAGVTAPLYALAEGLALGGISAVFNQTYHGIAIQAVEATFAVTLIMLFLYSSRVLRATPKFTMGVAAATGAIFLVYMVDMVMGFFHSGVPLLNSNGPFGILISVVIVGVAALNLILDFGFVESGVQAGAPKYMEWYGAFGIMVTLVWMYIEMLRLLSKLNNR